MMSGDLLTLTFLWFFISLTWVGIGYSALASQAHPPSCPCPGALPELCMPQVLGRSLICSWLPEGLWGPWGWHQELPVARLLCMVVLQVLTKPMAFPPVHRGTVLLQGHLETEQGDVHSGHGWIHPQLLFANTINCGCSHLAPPLLLQWALVSQELDSRMHLSSACVMCPAISASTNPFWTNIIKYLGAVLTCFFQGGKSKRALTSTIFMGYYIHELHVAW